MRLDKYLSNSGLGSRSQVKKLIKDKRIKVNEEIVKSDSFDVNEEKDVVSFDDTLIRYKKYIYVVLNKPQGYVSAVDDNLYSPVVDLVEEFKFANLFPVGRLDVDTTGVILLTNDGELTHKLISPKYHVPKTYKVVVDKKLKSSLIDTFKEGILLDEELTLPGELKILSDFEAELTIYQGKFHQVKRMFQKCGYLVIKLDRKSFAFLSHEGLDIGEYRELTLEEEKALINLVK